MTDAAKFSVIEKLRDGRTVEIRSVRPEDRSAMERAIRRGSPQSLYRRFFAVKREFTDKEADFFLKIDFVRHVALVAVVEENDKPTIVAGARYVAGQPGEAEVAFSVVDEYQGKGLGTLLMRHLANIAINAGYKTLNAEVLAENAPMLKVFEKCGHRVSRKRDRDVMRVAIELNKE